MSQWCHYVTTFRSTQCGQNIAPVDTASVPTTLLSNYPPSATVVLSDTTIRPDTATISPAVAAKHRQLATRSCVATITLPNMDHLAMPSNTADLSCYQTRRLYQFAKFGYPGVPQDLLLLYIFGTSVKYHDVDV